MGLVAVSHRSPLLVAVLLGAATVLTLRSVAPEFHVDLGPMHFDIGVSTEINPIILMTVVLPLTSPPHHLSACS